MSFISVRPNDCATGEAQSGRLKRWLATGTLCGALLSSVALSTSVQAEWQDPLTTPAMKTDKAHLGLLLDVTDAEERLVAVGAHGHIIYSDNQGVTWAQGNVPVTSTLTSVDFAGAQQGWAVGHDGVILASTDGGQSWAKQFDGYEANSAILDSARQFLTVAEERLQTAEESGDDMVIDQAMIALEDAQFAMQDAEYDLQTGSTKPFLDVYFWDAANGIAVGAYGMAFSTDNGGESWQELASALPNPNRLHLNAITPVGETSLVITGEMGLMLRSDDMGESWVSQNAPYDGSLFGLLDRGSYQLLFALRGHLYRSDDDGVSWYKLKTDSEQTLLGGYNSDYGTVLVGNGGALLTLTSRFEEPSATTIKGRKGIAAIHRVSSGQYVMVGEAGVQLVDDEGRLSEASITMNAEEK